MADKPRLRNLEAFPVEQDGERRIALRDPAGFTEHVAVLPIPLLDLVSLFDGEHSIDEIQDVLRRRHGEAPTAEQIAGVIATPRRGGIPRQRALRRAPARRGGRLPASPLRAAVHAGGAYAGEPGALAAQIDGFFSHPDGPGAAPDPAGPPLRGLIAPHIDFHRGGPTYAWAYRELRRSDADLFVVLGTCHAGMEDPFAVTLKPYDTPLGAVPVDRDLYEALARRSGSDLLRSETAHRAEHSIEFQAVMLRHVLGDRPFEILPVLASFVHEAVWSRGDPERDPRVPRFLDALLEAMAARRGAGCA